jgi:hypothetical protein
MFPCPERLCALDHSMPSGSSGDACHLTCKVSELSVKACMPMKAAGDCRVIKDSQELARKSVVDDNLIWECLSSGTSHSWGLFLSCLTSCSWSWFFANAQKDTGSTWSNSMGVNVHELDSADCIRWCSPIQLTFSSAGSSWSALLRNIIQHAGMLPGYNHLEE